MKKSGSPDVKQVGKVSWKKLLMFGENPMCGTDSS